MNYLPLFIGWRYLFSKRRERFVSFVSFFSILAMGLGVMTLITVLSVMNGFDHEVKTRILQIVPHGTIDTPNGLESWQPIALNIAELDNISAVVPYIAGQAMLTYRNRMEGVSMHGVLPEQGAIKESLGSHLQSGKLDDLQAGQYNIMLGRLLAQALDVGVGDKVLLTLPDLVITPAGVFPRIKKLRVAGIFETGAQTDSHIVFIHLNDASRLLRLGGKVTGLRLFMDDPFSLGGSDEIQSLLPEGYRLTTWHESMSELFSAIKMEKAVVGLLLSAIIVMASLMVPPASHSTGMATCWWWTCCLS